MFENPTLATIGTRPRCVIMRSHSRVQGAQAYIQLFVLKVLYFKTTINMFSSLQIHYQLE